MLQEYDEGYFAPYEWIAGFKSLLDSQERARKALRFTIAALERLEDATDSERIKEKLARQMLDFLVLPQPILPLAVWPWSKFEVYGDNGTYTSYEYMPKVVFVLDKEPYATGLIGNLRSDNRLCTQVVDNEVDTREWKKVEHQCTFEYPTWPELGPGSEHVVQEMDNSAWLQLDAFNIPAWFDEEKRVCFVHLEQSYPGHVRWGHTEIPEIVDIICEHAKAASDSHMNRIGGRTRQVPDSLEVPERGHLQEMERQIREALEGPYDEATRRKKFSLLKKQTRGWDL